MSVFTLNQTNEKINQINISTSDKNNNISSKKDLLMESLIQFFSIKENLDQVKPIINGSDSSKNKPKMSLRILDWFVTNYSKKHNITYEVKTENKTKTFIVYLDYKSQLKAYSKKQFDPFCRRERILFFDHEGKEIVTTVGQLNFFRWSLENNILKYILDNFEEIENDMNNSLRNLYKKKNGEEKVRRKRTELSISATKTVNKHDVSIIVQFD